ncbi:MFS transporter [Brachybacterium phenoliresistens]|uniref:MFS transporter n=1 Tax=Brachybacterium phenoliresistens TaxID=396014 RepID=UPI0031E2208A
MTTPVHAGPVRSRTERLDALPLSPRHRRMLGASGIGWALDAMDVGLVSFVIAALAVHWDLTAGERSLIASVGFAGMAIGAVLGGLLADRIGRRQVFALTLLVYGLATGASALSTGLVMLVALRFVVGLGLGAELPVASTLMSEFAPKRIRGRVIVWLEAFWALGWILAALIGTLVVAGSDAGWRWALLIGAVPAVYALVIRWRMPESVRYLESRGRHAEAEATVRALEESAGVPAPTAAESAAAGGPAAGTASRGGESIWSAALRGRTAALWIVWFCVNLAYYGAFIWIPTLLVDRGFDLTRSFTFTLIITLAQLPGYAVSSWLIEVIGRRWTLGTFLVGSAGSAIAFGLADAPGTIILTGCLLSFFNLGAWGALYAISPEVYPTTVRGTGSGAAAGFGRLASIIAPIMVPLVVAASGVAAAFAVIAAAFAIGAAAAFALPEQRGRALVE